MLRLTVSSFSVKGNCDCRSRSDVRRFASGLFTQPAINKLNVCHSGEPRATSWAGSLSPV